MDHINAVPAGSHQQIVCARIIEYAGYGKTPVVAFQIGQIDVFERVLFLYVPVQPLARSEPEGFVGIHEYVGDVVVGDGQLVVVLVEEILDVVADEAVEPVFAGYPDETVQVLVNQTYPAARKPMVGHVKPGILGRDIRMQAKKQANDQ
jgi:hypothetical protein